MSRTRRAHRAPHPFAPMLSALAAGLALTACGGSDDTPAAPPQLSEARPGALSGTCADVATRLSTLTGTTISAVTTVATGTLKVAGTDVPAHCLVSGKTAERTGAVDGKAYAIGFEMRLPLAWNGRFFHQGNGGTDGNVVTATGSFGGGPTTHALMQGFAVLSSDAGHSATQNPSFGIDPQARLDYGYQAVGKMTPIARQVIQAAYGRAADRSYFGGCSNGGRHAMVTAARYPADYDGYVVGAPGFNLPLAAVANIDKGRRYASVATTPTDLSTAITAAERRVVSNAVLARCDALDGATDGLVQDVAACQAAFDWNRDVPTCTGARDGTCLTAAQKTAIAPIFSGAVDSTGRVFYAKFPYDAGYGGAGIPFWAFTAPLQLDSGAVGLIFSVPPENATGFNGPAFTLGANIDNLLARINATNGTYVESAMQFMTPPGVTNLNPVRDRGGKMLVYHGVSDPIFSVADTTRWYDELAKGRGGDASDFVRLFRVPGMGHCSGGPATDQFDPLSAVVAWVERGVAPASLRAQARGAGNAGGVNGDVPADWAATRSRPLCPYPSVARYKGSGSLDDAANFECRP